MPKKKTTEKKAPKASKSTPSTQRYLDIAEIREETVIMKDGTLRAVLLVSSMNFALKSEDEQNATVQAYMMFLNSLEFPLQIVIQSRKLNVEKYLLELEKREKELTNDLLRVQINDYRQYVSELIELGDIMSKKFFIVVPYDPVSDKKKGFFTQLRNVFTPGVAIRLKQKEFADRKHILDQRVANVMNGLVSMSLQAIRLDTQSLIELYYNTYNPDVAPQEKLVEIEKIQVE